MDFHHVKNDFQASTPKNYKSKSKGVSPTKFRRASNGYNPSDSQVYSSNMSSPSRLNFPVSAFENDSFRVYVRVRPLDSKEMVTSNPKDRVNIIKVDENTLHVLNPYIGSEWSSKPEKTYFFNRVFDTEIQTAKLYEDTLSSTVENIINGYNSTILAYGMTGAGKTFTMFGDIANVKGGPTVHPGIVSLVVNDLFAAFDRELQKGFEFNIRFSYLEIYNEHVRDLLAASTEDLMIIEDAEKGIAIPNLSEFQITSLDDVLKLIVQGNARRVMASTHANQFSSRSHAVIQLLIEKKSRTRDITEPVVQSKLCLVDLAGSERAAVSENKGLRHREGANINRSLLALGNCINILSDPNKRGAFVPYRDSKLTRLLKESLGGNTQTVMVACVSPSNLAYEETVNTLKYALRARNIQKKVVQNVQEVDLHVSEYKEIIGGLRAEVNFLKQKLGENNEQPGAVQQKLSADYVNKVNVMLDDLGRKLVNIFQEHYEFIQSNDELENLKGQNEEILRSKVQQLGKVAGDAQLYSKVTKEISALKEVMVNNEKIQKEIEANLERTEEEKKLVQHQILGMIAQTCQNSETVQREICLEEIARGSPLLNMEDPTLKKIMHVPEEDTFESAEKEIKMQELMDEVEEMKRQLAEKDRLLIQNQKIIQFFLQSGTKIPNFRSASSKKLIPNCSPSKKNNSNDPDRDSTKWVELSHQEQDLKAADSTFMINRVPTTAQMPSMSNVNTHHRVLSPRSLERISALLFGRTNSSISLSKGPDSSRTGGTDQNYHPIQRIVERVVDNHLSQRSGTSSIEEFNYLSYINNTNFEDKGNHSRRSSNYSQKMMENISTPILQVSTARITDQPNGAKTNTSSSATFRHHTKSLSNSIPYSQEANTTIDTYQQSRSPQNQFGLPPSLMRRNTGESIPSNSSSIAFHARDNSHEFSFKDSFSENSNNVGRQVKTSAKPKSNQHENKENLHKKATSPKSSFSTTVAYSSRINSQKSPTSNPKPNTIKTKFSDISSPELKSMSSPNSALNKAKSPFRASCSPDKVIIPKSPNQLGLVSPSMSSKQSQSQIRPKTTGLRVEVSLETNLLGESMRENLADKKILNESVLTPTVQSNKSTAQKSDLARDKKSSVSIFSSENLQPKSDIKTLDTRRDAAKGFRTKLHQLANSVSNNSRISNTSLREISSLLDEYRSNAQTYSLTTGDSTAFKKLELALTNPFNQQNFLGEITEHDSGSDTMRTKEMSEIPLDTGDFSVNITPSESLKKYERSPNMTFARNSKVIARASSVDENNLYTDQTSKTGLERLDEPQMSTQNESSLGSTMGGPFTFRGKDVGNTDKVRTQITKNFKLIRDARKR